MATLIRLYRGRNMDTLAIGMLIVIFLIIIIFPVIGTIVTYINRNKTTVYTVEYEKLKSLIESAEKLHVDKIDVSMLFDLIEVKEESK